MARQPTPTEWWLRPVSSAARVVEHIAVVWKPVVAQALGGEPVDGRRPDGRAVAAEIGEADVVEQHDQDVGRARRRLLGASGHQGFDSATVLPIVPPNGVPLSALMPFLPAVFVSGRG